MALPSLVYAMKGARSGVLIPLFLLVLFEFYFLPSSFQLRTLKVALLQEPGQHSLHLAFWSCNGLAQNYFANINNQDTKKLCHRGA